jgi:hypothetical protein
VWRELVSDDPEREGEHGAADALDHAAGDQHLDRVRQRGHQRPETERNEREYEHPLLAEDVTEAPDDRRGHRCAQEVRGQHEGDRGRGGVQVVLDRR